MADRRPHPKAPPVITRDGVLRAPPAPRRRPRPSHRHPPPECPPPLLDRKGPARNGPAPSTSPRGLCRGPSLGWSARPGSSRDRPPRSYPSPSGPCLPIPSSCRRSVCRRYLWPRLRPCHAIRPWWTSRFQRDTAPVTKHYSATLLFGLLRERRTGPSSEFTSIYETCVELARPGPYTREDFRRSQISSGARRIQDREADTSWRLLWQPLSSVIPGATRISPSTSRSTPSAWRRKSSKRIRGRS